MARILVVDDDPALLDVLSLAFAEAGHEVSTARDGAAGLAALLGDRLDVAVVDVGLPKVDGFTVVRRARAAGVRTPILILTSRDDEIDEALGLELGADDYVGKPFSTRVLLARVAALVRRDALRGGRDVAGASAAIGDDEMVVVGPLRVDGARLTATWRDAPLTTTLTELRLLAALASERGRVLSRAQLLAHARGDDGVVGERLIDTYVRRLRRKLEAIDPSFDRIETVVGAGYRWREG